MMREGSVVAGKYRLEHPLGEGAMGVVWAAVNAATERRVAVKVMASALAGSEEGRARLIREARACGRIAHRNVIEVLDAGETDDGAPYIVMPLLVGETLAARMERAGPLPQSTAAFVALEIARGLAAAHAAGIVHRDLKPGNVFLLRDPETAEDAVKILDFGVSKVLGAQDAAATATGSALGSPAYMAPEQVRGVRDIDHRADLWALGVVLFEMLGVTRPFVGDSVYTVAGEILSGRIPDVREHAPSTDPRLAAIIASCLERDVQRRVGTAGEIVQGLRAVLGVPAAAVSGPVLAFDDATRVMEHRERTAPSVTSTTPVLGGAALVPPPRRSALPFVAVIGVITVMGLLSIGSVVFLKAHRSAQETTAPLEPTKTVTHQAASAPEQQATSVAPTAMRLEDLPTSTETTRTTPGVTSPRVIATVTTTATSPQPPRPVETREPRAPATAKSASPKPKTLLPMNPG